MLEKGKISSEAVRISYTRFLFEHIKLYNLNKDPYEKENLIFSNNYQNKIKSLKDKIKNWQKKTEDQVKLD